MKNFYSFPGEKRRAMRGINLLLGMIFLWGISVISVSAQTNSGNTITFDANNSTMLFADLSTNNLQQYSCYLRHHQAPIQIINANPQATGNEVAALQSEVGTGTGFFANSHLANNMAFATGGDYGVEFYNFANNYQVACFAIIAPKGYRFTEYYMDISSNQYQYSPQNRPNGSKGATIMRYTYNAGSTYQYTPCTGESLTLSSDGKDSEIFTHTLSNAENILYFRIDYGDKTKAWATHMNVFRLKYVIEDEVEVSIPNSDGTKVHTGYIDFGALTQKSGAGQYYFNKTNVTDLQEVKIVADDATAEMIVSNGAINVSKASTYWMEAPAKYRIVSASMTFQPVIGSTTTEWIPTTEFTSGRQYKISDGNGNYISLSNNGTGITNKTDQSAATIWTITKNGSYYTIKSSTGRFLSRNSGNLTTQTSSFNWQYNSTSRYFYDSSYRIRYNNNNWSASSNVSYTPTTLTYYYEKTTSISGNDTFTATLYGTNASQAVGTVNISASNPSGSITADSLDNDGIKFIVDGPAAFTVDLTLAPLDPTLQTLEFGYRLKDGTTDAGHYISTNATNFKFNAGETIVLPIAPEDGGNGDSHKVIFHNAINENKSAWYDGTGSGTKDSQYYLVGSEYEETGSTTTVPYGRTEANQAGTVEVEFSNLNSLTSGGGRLTETPFNKTDAGYQDIVLADNGAAQKVYIYSADKPTHGIMAAAGKAQNNHIAYTFYEATLQAVDIIEEPVIEVTTIYTSTLKGDNVKVAAYNGAMGTSVSVAKDSDLDTDHEFYGVKVTSRLKEGTGSPLGYLNCSDIITAIKAELSKETYKVYAGDVMRTILYVDMSELNSVSGDFDDWKEIMLGTADNCLFFNPAGFSISQDMIGGGLIAGGNGGTAVTDIVVNDQQPFFSPYEFYTSTHKARYFRTKVNGKALPKNTTIVLPFTVVLDSDGHLKTSGDNVDENVTFYNLTTELSPGIGEAYNVGTEVPGAASSVGTPLALAFKPYHLTSEEQTETTAFVVEASGTTIPVTPAPGADAFKNTDTGMVGYGSLNGVSIAKDEGIFYFSKEKFWNSSTLADGKTVKILPYRAYYKTNNAGIKSLSEFGVNFDESVATGIKDIENENVAKGVYDLTGRRVADDIQSLTRGIYIVNGKKVFIK